MHGPDDYTLANIPYTAAGSRPGVILSNSSKCFQHEKDAKLSLGVGASDPPAPTAIP
jgi:hypothetical protein